MTHSHEQRFRITGALVTVKIHQHWCCWCDNALVASIVFGYKAHALCKLHNMDYCTWSAAPHGLELDWKVLECVDRVGCVPVAPHGSLACAPAIGNPNGSTCGCEGGTCWGVPFFGLNKTIWHLKITHKIATNLSICNGEINREIRLLTLLLTVTLFVTWSNCHAVF